MAWPGPVNGSMFLVSQLHYLRGLDCSRDELHLLCTDRLDADWASALATFGVAEAAAPPRERDRGGARAHVAGTPAFFAQRRSVLSEAERQLVRERLYPWDAKLHRWACGGTREESSSLTA